MITIDLAMIEAAIQKVIADHLTPEAIEAMVKREIERRTATMSLKDAAASQGWTETSFRRLLRRKGVKIVALTSCRDFRVRVTDLEQLITDHTRPLGVRKRKKISTPDFQKAA